MANVAGAANGDVEVAVVGGGIAGLAAAWRLRQRGIDVRVLESDSRAGGLIATERRGDYLLEWGPHSFPHSASHILELARSLEIDTRVVRASAAARARYVFSRGRLRRVPRGPISLLFGSLLSPRARIRALREPWVRSRSAPSESVQAFFSRRFGGQVAERIVTPFVSGIYAGAAEELEIAAAFPQVVAWEREQGSVLRGAMRARRAPAERSSLPPGVYGFRGGMEELPSAIAEALGERLRLGVEVLAIAPGPRSWQLRVRGANGTTTLGARCVIIALPAHRTAELIRAALPASATELAAIPYAPVAVVQVGIRADALTRRLDGFGFLTEPRENLPILGCIWASAIFDERAPSGHVLLTGFLGGRRRSELASAPRAELEACAAHALAATLTKQGAVPELLSSRSISRAIPQFAAGHRRRVERLHTIQKELGSLLFAGNYLEGVSVEHAAASGVSAAEAAIVSVR